MNLTHHENYSIEYPKTVFFEACRGVFEGGGCRAAAHVGAYDASLKCGINFSEVAGTSAGSIVASLVGAGATPEFLDAHLSQLDFTRFLKDPEKHELSSGWFLSLVGRILHLPLLKRLSIADGIGKIIRYGGFYSSVPIELWIDDVLSELLPTAPRPINFKDLLLPTRIVATDLVAGKAKIWGTRETPNERVGYAVRCSCSIPGFFQPVSSGTNQYVDGGVLSNLPAFVFSDADNIAGPSLGGRIIAFRLEEDFRGPRKWSVKFLLERLLATIVSGATELQVAMKGDVHIVLIPTGTTRATDFRKINEKDIKRLQKSGETATVDFINDEAVKIQDKTDSKSSCWDRDELDDAIVRAALEPAKEIFIAETDTKWFWKLFPSVFHWLSKKTQVKILVTPILATGEKAAREKQRRDLLIGMGAEVKVEKNLPLNGYFIRREDNNRDAAIMIHQRGTEDAPAATTYIGSHHREIIAAACEQLIGYFAGLEEMHVKLQSQEPENLIKLLKKNVWQYSSPDVQIKVEEVDVENIEFITRFVRSYKYRQIAYLAEAYEAAGIPLFAAAAVFANSNQISIVTPPVIEMHGSHFVAIEGNTRLLYCRRNDINKLNCFVVRGVKKLLPGRPVDPRRVVLATRHMKPSERIEGFNYDRFRSIEGAVRPVKEILSL